MDSYTRIQGLNIWMKNLIPSIGQVHDILYYLKPKESMTNDIQENIRELSNEENYHINNSRELLDLSRGSITSPWNFKKYIFTKLEFTWFRLF
jgi:hypothetical protein